jgi:hypothetical protein
MLKKLRQLFTRKVVDNNMVPDMFTGKFDPRDYFDDSNFSDLKSSNPNYFFDHVESLIINLKKLHSINSEVSSDLSKLQGAFSSWRKNFNLNNISIKKIDIFFSTTIKCGDNKKIYNYHVGYISRLNSYFVELLKIANK